MLDTNIYGQLAVDVEVDALREKYLHLKSVCFYGSSIVRKELRATAKSKKNVSGSNLRIFMLTLYDELVKNHNLSLDKNVEEVALKYHNAYRQMGGFASREEMLNDFTIIALASIHDLEVVASNDNASMFNNFAIAAYKLVNDTLNLRMPKFINYDDFKKLLLRGDV